MTDTGCETLGLEGDECAALRRDAADRLEGLGWLLGEGGGPPGPFGALVAAAVVRLGLRRAAALLVVAACAALYAAFALMRACFPTRRRTKAD